MTHADLEAAERHHQAFDDARILWERHQLDTAAFLREAFIAAKFTPELIAEIRQLRKLNEPTDPHRETP